MWHWKRFPSKVSLLIPLLSLVFLAVACGAAEKPSPTIAPQPAAPAAPVAAPTSIPTQAAVAAPAPTATSVPAPAAQVNPGKLTIMLGNLGAERFDAALVSGTGATNYARIMHGYLISDNEKGEMAPGIASQWSLSADGLTWTFTIRKGVKFHDGSELTPQDVLWTFQHYWGPQSFEYVTSERGGIARALDRIELSGPDKASFTTKVPFIGFPNLHAEAGSLFYAVLPRRAKQHDTAEELAYDKKPIGAGFMRLVKHVPVSVMKFERFDDFYYQPRNGFPEDKRVNFKSLDMFLVPEEATRVAALRAGEADIVPVSLASKKQVEAGGGRLVFGQEGVYVEVKLMGCWGVPQLPCHDKRVRQALDYAIDKELIRDKLYGGPEVFQVNGWNTVTTSTVGYTPALDWPFDPNKARQLLADAGYPAGKGFGKLILNTYPSISMPLQPEAAQLAAEFWRRQLGLDVEVKVVDRTGLTKQERAGELRGQIKWGDNETRKDAVTWYSTNYGAPDNITRLHDDPELFRLVQETFQILDADQRAEASKKLYLRLRDESYQLGVGYANIPWAVGPRLLTWKPYALALYPSALHTITLK